MTTRLKFDLDGNNVLGFIDLIIKCGSIAKKLRNSGLKIEKKSDGSAVTNADKELDLLIVQGIKDFFGTSATIISEEDETTHNTTIKDGQPFWSIDPIDSTTSFIKGSSYYCVSVAYIENNTPVFGLIYAPDMESCWYGSIGDGCYKKLCNNSAYKIQVRSKPKDGTTMISSTEQKTPLKIIEELNIIHDIKVPSAIKFPLIAEGQADYFYREPNKACDWDMAAGHAIILAAGGKVNFLSPYEGFRYGIPPYRVPCLLAKGNS